LTNVTKPVSEPAFVVGIDVGGTFTDFVLFRPAPGGGTFTHHKEPSSPDDPARAVGDGLIAVMASAGVARDAEGVILHGTTIALNAILQDRGAPVALITSRGNRDVLEIGRARMPSSFNFALGKERRVVPRDRVLECSTRIGPDGVAITTADDTELDAIAARIRAWDLPAVAVMLLNSYVDKAPETDIAKRLSARLPGVHFVASSDIWPEIREYERALVAVLNAQITPLMDGYLRRLETLLTDAGIRATVFISASNGGVLGLTTARARPIDTILSGPASGVTAAVAIAATAGIERIVSFDMGGTSTDISMVRRGVAEFTNQTTVGDLPVILPSVDVSAIGAGGGSIIHADEQGLLKVGPASAGAAPGPAAYGRGGERPTITDCYVANGWIDPDHFLGGRMRLDRELARGALRAVARQSGHADLSEPQVVADAALRIATARMATGLTRHLAQRRRRAQLYAAAVRRRRSDPCVVSGQRGRHRARPGAARRIDVLRARRHSVARQARLCGKSRRRPPRSRQRRGLAAVQTARSRRKSLDRARRPAPLRACIRVRSRHALSRPGLQYRGSHSGRHTRQKRDREPV
jgi:N-methylhydantoinase A